MIYPIQHIPDCIPLGIQTEKGVQEIGFDVKHWLDAWDGLELAVYPTRPGEDSAYPASDVELIGTVLYWYPNDADTAIAGEGKVEIVGVTADKRKLSGATRTVVSPTSMTATQEPPDTIKPFYDSIIHAGHEAKVEAAKYAGEAAAHAQEASASAETAGTYLGNVDASAKSAAAAAQEAKQSETAAASSAESAEKAKADAVANADDAEAAAKEAKTWAERAEAHAGNAGASSDSAATSAKAASAYAQEAKDVVADILNDMRGDDGRGGLFLVGMNRNVSPVRLTRTYSEIAAAIDAGDTCLFCERGQAYLCRGYEKHPTTGETCIVFLGDTKFSDKYGAAPMYKYIAQDGTITESGTYVKSPNPQALTVKHGETTTTYNGAEQKYIDLTGIAGDAADIVIIKTKATNEGVYLADHEHAEIEEAISAGKLCLLLHGGTVYPYETFATHDNKRCAAFYGRTDIREDAGAAQVYAYIDTNRVVSVEGSFVKIPNPQAMTITRGDTTTIYDGSEPVNVEIPEGEGLTSIEQTTTSTADGGANVITATLSDGTTSTFTILNGSKGSDGKNGTDGADGYSPVRGTDYWTAEDIATIKAYVDDAILNGAW